MIKTIEWTDDGVVMLDQRVLPREEVYLTFTLPEEVIEAIANLVIRGAPAIGVAAAMGMALGAQFFADDEQEFRGQLLDLSDRMNLMEIGDNLDIPGCLRVEKRIFGVLSDF